MFEGASLFIGALLDALIGPNLFVPGEPFLIAAGYQLYQGALTGVVAVLLGGFIGDQLSYLIGRRAGSKFQRKLTRWQPKTRRAFARARLLMKRRGIYVLAFSRLLGPVAWVVPFVAGINHVTWKRFTTFSSIGLILGVGQFVAWGYLMAYGLNNIPVLNEVKVFVIEHAYSLFALLFSLCVAYLGWKRGWRFLGVKSIAALLLALVVSNYGHFFMRADDLANVVPDDAATISVDTIEAHQYKAYPGKSNYFKAQAVNIVYVGESPKPLMQTLGWLENQTFSRNDIEFNGYIELLKGKTPPVSDLFWQGEPQHMAFQLPGDLLKRSHIRWWFAGEEQKTGQNIWVGAVSYDDGLKITPYSGIITVLHRIDPNVDVERDAIAENVLEVSQGWDVEYFHTERPIALDDGHDYYTDGRILVISDSMTLHAANRT
ncbi:LssY C-terminal domain-containing protein [Vibrio sp. SCSIO 43135]|uniref:LssY C-terminal domain-containing protein n=1 Tax=Vibrio sp. SCSIO 43135 TaxID=2819096 RepID=UPI002076636D|nr:LssY C-terminal domain-containing protein [Vibrio sp. SCSIO 43135]USD40075.1 LssY C-terminal domain-containing protein [Vibrio sp. SCSIO 43135]